MKRTLANVVEPWSLCGSERLLPAIADRDQAAWACFATGIEPWGASKQGVGRKLREDWVIALARACMQSTSCRVSLSRTVLVEHCHPQTNPREGSCWDRNKRELLNDGRCFSLEGSGASGM